MNTHLFACEKIKEVSFYECIEAWIKDNQLSLSESFKASLMQLARLYNDKVESQNTNVHSHNNEIPTVAMSTASRHFVSFVRESFEFGKTHSISKSDFQNLYSERCSKDNIFMLPEPLYEKMLKKLGIGYYELGSACFYQGLKFNG